MSNQHLKEIAEEFVFYKQSIGYVYKEQKRCLNNYVFYAESTAPDTAIPDKKTITGYLNTMLDKRGALYNNTSVLREFARYLIKRGYAGVYLIPPKWVPQPVAEPPYFFTEHEIKSFFTECDSILPCKCYPGRELILPALYRILYCCGLRCKEVRTLLCDNMHLHNYYIDVIQSKGPKSRRIYISAELANYLNNYDIAISLKFPGRKYFFPRTIDYCYGKKMVSNNFRRLWEQAFPEFTTFSRPRAFDFRHHFAWANLNRWAKEGQDVNVMLPYLMNYMGHRHIKNTLYYFHFVPEFFPAFAEMAKPTESIMPEVAYEE